MDKTGSRELAQEVASRHHQKPEEFHRFMPIVQFWIRSNLFDAAGVGPDEQNPRRGKSRRFPPEARKWVRLFSTLADRGIATVEVEYLAGTLHRRFQNAVDDALAGRGDDVWCIYGSAPPLVRVEDLHIQRGAAPLAPAYPPDLPGPAVITCVNLTKAFNP